MSSGDVPPLSPPPPLLERTWKEHGREEYGMDDGEGEREETWGPPLKNRTAIQVFVALSVERRVSMFGVDFVGRNFQLSICLLSRKETCVTPSIHTTHR